MVIMIVMWEILIRVADKIFLVRSHFKSCCCHDFCYGTHDIEDYMNLNAILVIRLCFELLTEHIICHANCKHFLINTKRRTPALIAISSYKTLHIFIPFDH